MHKFRNRNAVAILISIMFLLSACGQKGDLYLPEGQANTVKIG